jgi:hypothetical protein
MQKKRKDNSKYLTTEKKTRLKIDKSSREDFEKQVFLKNNRGWHSTL